MMKNKTIKTSLLFSFVLMSVIASAQIRSPFNQRLLTDTASTNVFIVSGHFHGSSNNGSTFPAATLLAGIDTLNAMKPAFLMSLGDLFLDVDDRYIRHYQQSLFNKLQMPLFNAVGNHDVSNKNRYEKEYGKAYYSFVNKGTLFIVMNTELNDGSIKDEQLKMFKDVLKKAKEDAVKNVFIFSHRPVWAEENPAYTDIFRENTRSRFGAPNYEKEIKPLLENLTIPVYWISGSMGNGPACFFYDKDKKSGITYMQTAIRDTPRDAVLLVSIVNGQVLFKGVSLTGEELQPIENYDVVYWKQATKETVTPFRYRMLPHLTYQMIRHCYFWIGAISGICLLIILRSVIKKWKRKK
jgi:hypothetical protein